MNNQFINKKLISAKKASKMQIIPLVAFTLAFLSSQASYAEEQVELEADTTRSVMKAKHGRHNQMNYMIRKLQLDTKQQADIKAIRKAVKVENKAVFESLKRYHSELNLLIKADYFDEQAAITLHNAYQLNLTQVAITKAKTRHDILQVLSEQQKVKWFALIEKRQEKRKNNRK